MVRMLPDFISSEVKSAAEKKLFKQFKDTDTNEHIVILHSLGVAEHVNNIFGEIDFVIICHSGFLCVEVKGGVVEREEGTWSFTNRYGKKDYKNVGPFEQVQGNMQSLLQYIQKKVGKEHPFSRAQFASCVLMPDCRFDFSGGDVIPQILFDKATGIALDQVLRTSFEYWSDDCYSRHHFRGGFLTDDEIDNAANLLRGDFHVIPSLRDIISDRYQQLVALTDEQYMVMEGLDDEDNPRLMISGLAGTGKSLLAVEQCKRAARSGKKALYLCYNRNMAHYVQTQFDREDLDCKATTLHNLMDQTCGIRYADHNQLYFSVTLPQRFINTDEHIREYDLVVMDEGQDLLNETYLRCVDRIIKSGLSKGSWAVFYDPNQNIYNKNSEMTKILPKLKKLACNFNLSVNCRNTSNIALTNTLITAIPQVTRLKADGPDPKLLPYTTKENERDQLFEEVRELLQGGVKGKEIVLLSPYNIENVHCCLYNTEWPLDLGYLKTDGRIWNAKESEIRFSTIPAFKGLESRVIIFIDLDNFKEESHRLLNYVGISRAEIILDIFYDEACENDRNDMLVKGYKLLN